MLDLTRSSIAIVGGGAFATYALERLAARVRGAKLPRPLTVHIFNPTPRFGSGMAQDWAQPGTSMMNRVAAQIGFAADESNGPDRPLLPIHQRFDFVQWAHDRYQETGNPRYHVGPRDAPARAVHGEALSYAFDQYCTILRSLGAQVFRHVATVADIEERDQRLWIYDDAQTLRAIADTALLVTGHPDNRPAPGSMEAAFDAHAHSTSHLRYVHQVFPLDTNLDASNVAPGSTVGLIGMGLTSLDAILHLTEGRGGYFEATPSGQLKYRRSGHEPSLIVPCSTSGMFVETRAANGKVVDATTDEVGEEHIGRFLTLEAVEALRNSVGKRASVTGRDVLQLDFERHLFPLVVLEMKHVYERTAAGQTDLGAATDTAYAAFLRAPPRRCADGIKQLLDPAGDFNWASLFYPLAKQPGRAGWGDRLLVHLRQDIIDAREGNLRNPRKAACDGVWRDLRAVFSSAVDRGGLTAASQRSFGKSSWRHYCRMSNGPPLAVSEKLLALMEAGIVDCSIGPAPQFENTKSKFRIHGTASGATQDVSVLINARTHDFDLTTDRNPLYRNLERRGLVRRWRNPGQYNLPDFVPGCLDLDLKMRTVGVNDRVNPRLTVLGAPAERLIYFHLSAARPNSNSSILNYADDWAADAINMLNKTRDVDRA